MVFRNNDFRQVWVGTYKYVLNVKNFQNPENSEIYTCTFWFKFYSKFKKKLTFLSSKNPDSWTGLKACKVRIVQYYLYEA